MCAIAQSETGDVEKDRDNLSRKGIDSREAGCPAGPTSPVRSQCPLDVLVRVLIALLPKS